MVIPKAPTFLLALLAYSQLLLGFSHEVNLKVPRLTYFYFARVFSNAVDFLYLDSFFLPLTAGGPKQY